MEYIRPQATSCMWVRSHLGSGVQSNMKIFQVPLYRCEFALLGTVLPMALLTAAPSPAASTCDVRPREGYTLATSLFNRTSRLDQTPTGRTCDSHVQVSETCSNRSAGCRLAAKRDGVMAMNAGGAKEGCQTESDNLVDKRVPCCVMLYSHMATLKREVLVR